jgi:hypothetical protein
MTQKKSTIPIGFDLTDLNILDTDMVARKMLMLIEGTYVIGVKQSIVKYGYSEPRYYQLLKAFKEQGSVALIDKKTGPKNNSKRTDVVTKQILRLRFLNPNDSAVIIAQKLNQQGMKISIRSVERTITQYGIQKKTATSLTRP